MLAVKSGLRLAVNLGLMPAVKSGLIFAVNFGFKLAVKIGLMLAVNCGLMLAVNFGFNDAVNFGFLFTGIFTTPPKTVTEMNIPISKSTICHRERHGQIYDVSQRASCSLWPRRPMSPPAICQALERDCQAVSEVLRRSVLALLIKAAKSELGFRHSLRLLQRNIADRLGRGCPP